MAELSHIERRAIEKLFGMSNGYVLDFSNRTFADFFADAVRVDIDDPQYHAGGSSKANRFRVFLRIGDDFIVGRVLNDLVDLVRENLDDVEQPVLKEKVRQIAMRLMGGHSVEDISVLDQSGIQPSEERVFRLLSVAVRNAIEAGEPEAALDRLHTYVVKYMRQICESKNIVSGEDRPLHSLMGEYAKARKTARQIESEITDRILKNSIAIMEAFNFVRNRHSLAHDNDLLGKAESTLIVSHIVSTIRFIQTLEAQDSQ